MLQTMIVVFGLVLSPMGVLADNGDTQANTSDDTVVIEGIAKKWVDRLDNSQNTSVNLEKKPTGEFVVSLTNEAKTAEGHGLFGIKWDQQEVANIKILKIDNQYIVSGVEGSVKSKAPWGLWRIEREGLPESYKDIVPKVGARIFQGE